MVTNSQIKRINAYPNELRLIANRFLALETDYNVLVKKFSDAKSQLNNKYKQAGIDLEKNKSALYDFEKQKFVNGEFLPVILQSTIEDWQNEKERYTFTKFAIPIAFILLIFTIPWYASIIGAILGWIIFNYIIGTINIKILNLTPFVSQGRATFTSQEQSQIKNISSYLKNKIEEAETFNKDQLSQLYSSIRKDKFEKNNRNTTKFKQLTISLDTQYQQALNTFISRADTELSLIDSKINLIKNDLNVLPETFDNNSKNWDSKSIVKGKDVISDILRVGQDIISIQLNKPYEIIIPRCIPCFNQSNISFDCHNKQELSEAIRLSHNLISRTLLSLPPARVKLIVIDPQDLGANAKPFTPLTKEIGGGLVSNQNSDIENKLVSIIRNIERIIKDCLQNRYTDLADYNNANKDVQEVYNLLVIYNFPNGFEDSTIKKILNIINSGSKTGVSVIFINDRNYTIPYGFRWADFDTLKTTKVSVQNGTIGNTTFENDKSLPHDLIVDYINKEYPKTSSHKVPFSKYLLDEQDWWKSESHDNLEVPIGKFGAEIQNIKFLTAGSESKSNAILIGKPGSGKSNLLHVIIANAICRYSPDQLELYLIDFKGGVEFVSYADNYIPHIRAIAIDSEREFGLSVLEKVEKEMLDRQKELNAYSLQNLIQYHNRFPKKLFPRILLIVDEFQKFYSEDDEIRRAVDTKLDNIVKQGRAFGINTLFASQTLSGNSINNSTRELYEIRIALMCAEADGEKIFEEKNKAAKDLVNAGEGIYNDKMGKNGYNKKFQAFYVEDDRSDLNALTLRIEKHSQLFGNKFSNMSQIVFRSSERARLEKSTLINFNSNSNLNARQIQLWLGQPIAIEDDVIAVLEKKGKSNLLIVGNDEEIGIRIIFSSIISIIKQNIAKESIFYFFNFFDSDTPQYRALNNLFKMLSNKFNVEIVEEKSLKPTLETIKQELKSRQISTISNFPNIFIILSSAQNAESLRKSGYDMTEDAKVLASIIKEGSSKGIHSIIQIDSMDSFSGKLFEDKLLPDFSQRIATQMNSDNSRKLLGNEKAMKLGDNRAYYFWDNKNKLVKFKPFEIPEISFLKLILDSIPNNQ